MEEMLIEKKKSEKIKVEHEGGRFLPEDITREILSRLPVKSLLRYMSVSRHWKSLISHNSFKKQHRQKILNNNNPPLLLALRHSDRNSFFLTTFNLNGKVIQEWNLPLILSTSDLFMLPFPSQSKLLCFLDIDIGKFYLCNPSTRRMFHLSDPPFDPIPCRKSYVGGFAYIPSKDEYVILHLAKPDINNWSCKMLTISISNDDDQLHFSSWRSVDVEVISHLDFYLPEWVFVYGAFYSMVFDYEVKDYVILSFNIENEGFSFIGMPDSEYNLRRQSLLEIKEKLYITTLWCPPLTLKLWMLSDVENQLWTHRWSIKLQSPNFFDAMLTLYRREYLKNYTETHKNISRDIGYLAVGILGHGFSL